MGHRYHFIVHPIHEISLCYCLLMIYILSICHAWDGCSDECYDQFLVLSASSIGVLDILLLLISINPWSRGSFKIVAMHPLPLSGSIPIELVSLYLPALQLSQSTSWTHTAAQSICIIKSGFRQSMLCNS